jgi:hypothetical protein
MTDEFEHLDLGRGTHHPLLDKAMFGSAGVALGALMVAVGPGLLVSSAADPPAQGEHHHIVVFRAICTEGGCHRWRVREMPGPTLVTRLSPGANAAVAEHYLTHEGCP